MFDWNRAMVWTKVLACVMALCAMVLCNVVTSVGLGSMVGEGTGQRGYGLMVTISCFLATMHAATHYFGRMALWLFKEPDKKEDKA